jgi:type I restriction enzyme S subunit
LNDVLINITGDSVARVCLAPKDKLPARVNQHVAIIRTVKNELDPKFVRYFLTDNNTQNHF